MQCGFSLDQKNAAAPEPVPEAVEETVAEAVSEAVEEPAAEAVSENEIVIEEPKDESLN